MVGVIEDVMMDVAWCMNHEGRESMSEQKNILPGGWQD